MKFLTLVCSGFGKEDAGFEFADVTQGLTVASGSLSGNFREVLSAVLFGKKQEDIEATAVPGVIELKFSDGDDEYSLARVYADKKEIINFTKNGEEVAIEEVRGTVGDILGRNKEYIMSLGFVTEELSEEFGKNGAKSYVGLIGDAEEKLSACIEKNEEEKIAAEARIANLSEMADGEESVSKSRYAEIDAKIREVERLSEELIAQGGRIKTLKAKQESVDEKIERLYDLDAMAVDIRRLFDFVNRCRKAEQIIKDEEEIERQFENRPEVEDKSDELQAAERKRDTLKSEVENGRQNEKKAESEVLYYADRLAELRDSMLDFVEEVSESGIAAISDETGEYAKQTDDAPKESAKRRKSAEEQRAEKDYAARRKAVEEERAALLLLIENLEEKRRELTYPAAYRKAVIDSARIESRMEKQNVVISESKKRISELETDIAKKSAELEKLDKMSAELEKAGAELLSKIIGDYPSREDAVNADAVRKNKLYSNHIIVKAQAAEIAAVNEKIAKLEQNSEELAEKREKLSAAKTEVEIHKAKLNHKLKLLGDKYNERIAENMYAKDIESLAYGDRCPVCDGYVVRKNANPKFVKVDDILADMDVLRKGVEEDDRKITRILLKLGAYMSAAESSRAYINSLKETAAKKQSLVDALLKECDAESPESLGEALRAAIEKSNELSKNVDLYYDLEGRMASVLEAQERVRFQIKKASEVDLQRQKKIYGDAMADVRVLAEEYKNYSEHLEGKRGTDLLPDLMSVDKELETMDEDISGARQRLAACEKEKNDIDNSLAAFSDSLPEGVDAAAVAGIAAKAVAKKLQYTADEIRKNEKEYENAKARFVAVKRITEDYAEHLSDAEIEVAQLSAQVEFKDVNADLENARKLIRARLKEFGVSDTAGLKDFIVSDEEKEEIDKVVRDYNAEIYMIEEAIKEVEEPEFDVEQAEIENEAARQALRDQMGDLYVERAEVGLKLSRQEKTARQIDEAEREFKKIKRNLQELRTLERTVEDGAINLDLLNGILLEKMSDAAFDMTKGAYRLIKDGDRIALVDEFDGGSVVAENELTTYQKLVRQLAISSVLSDTFDAVLDSDGSPFVIISGEKVTHREAALIVECSRERRLTVVSDSSINNALLEVM